MTNLITLAEQLANQLLQQQIKIVTAESCTGGQLAYVLTSVPGSSHWFERGFVTYSNQAKHEMLKVPAHIIKTYGAVSEETVKAMTTGALMHSHADLAIAITGIAGPSGGSVDKPVGTVWIGWGKKQEPVIAQFFHLTGNRLQIRSQAVAKAMEKLLEKDSHFGLGV